MISIAGNFVEGAGNQTSLAFCIVNISSFLKIIITKTGDGSVFHGLQFVKSINVIKIHQSFIFFLINHTEGAGSNASSFGQCCSLRGTSLCLRRTGSGSQFFFSGIFLGNLCLGLFMLDTLIIQPESINPCAGHSIAIVIQMILKASGRICKPAETSTVSIVIYIGFPPVFIYPSIGKSVKACR